MGLGHVHHVVTTQSAEAQQYFEQGLAYCYAFNSVFRDDLNRNPRNPRSLLGLAKSLEAQNRDEDGNASTGADNALRDADVAVTLADL